MFLHELGMLANTAGMARADHPTVLHSVADMLSRQVTTDRLLRAMVDRVVEELSAERGTLFLVDARSGELRSRVAHLPELDEIRLPPGRAWPATWPRPASP